MEMLSTLNEASAERVDSLKESTNKQKNQAVLDNLGENAEGELTYKGQDVGAPKLHLAEFVVDTSTTLIHTQYPMALTVEANIPLNARAKKVEIPDIVNQTDEYIVLEDMASKINTFGIAVPYFIMYPKGMVGQYAPVIVASVIFPTYDYNEFCNQVDRFEGKTIKIYYEIEE